jgi:Na+/H+ antiporter NhaD/arsenite permease-like protein
MNGETTLWLTAGLFTLTYIALAFGRVPGLRIDRAGIALVGATLMLVTGVLSFEQAISPDAIDYKTITLLFGMMVVVGFLRLSGLLQRVTGLAFDKIRSPRCLLAVTITISGVLSAFLINDIVCLALTPLVLHLARRLRFDPVPHLIALATAANIGSTGTITGNPQNIYIGSHSGIPYLRFAARLLPVAALGLVLNFVVIALVYRRQLTMTTGARGTSPEETLVADRRRSRHSQGRFRVLQGKSAIVALATVALFFTGLPLELVALSAAAVLLLSRIKPEHIYRQIDWSLLVMFIGLFVVVHAFQLHVVDHWGIEHWDGLLSRPVGLLSLVATLLSNLVSNVPAVLLMEPMLKAIPLASQETAWLALAMSSTLAGNLTVLGSVANLIVLANGDREGVRVSFREYCKVGVPLTILTLGLGIAWLEFVHY